MISTCNLIRSHRNSWVKNVKLLFGELAIIKNSKCVGLLEMLQQRSAQRRSTSVPDCEEINLDRHYSNQTCYPQTHLFFVDFHPPYQTFAETTCGHECISWKVCMYFASVFAWRLERQSWHFTIICRQILLIYTRCCLFVLHSPCQHKSKPCHEQEHVLKHMMIMMTPGLPVCRLRQRHRHYASTFLWRQHERLYRLHLNISTVYDNRATAKVPLLTTTNHSNAYASWLANSLPPIVNHCDIATQPQA